MITKPKSKLMLREMYIEWHEQEPSDYEIFEMDLQQRGISLDDWYENQYSFEKQIERRDSDAFEKLLYRTLKEVCKLLQCDVDDELEIEMLNVLFEASTEPMIADTKRDRIETVASWYPDFKINRDEQYLEILSVALATTECYAEVYGV